MFFENIPSDHVVVRVFIYKPTVRGHQGKRIPSSMNKHSFFCSILTQINDDHQYLGDPFDAFADFKFSIKKKQKCGLFASSHEKHVAAWGPSC